MGKPKLVKFAVIKTLSNVFDQDTQMKGKWRTNYFQNEAKLTVELACGKGEYTRGLAKKYPEENFIGMDIKGHRIFTAINFASEEEIENVAFIRDQIDHIADYFEADEVDEIWITFSDPFIQPRKARKRLTSPKYLKCYQNILKKGGLVHLKTDSDILYDYTLKIIKEQNLTILHSYNDIYSQNVTELTHQIQTYYEQMHLKNGLTIKYICFKIH